MPILRVKPLRFPRNFVWGVATAAPQIEGAAFEDGKGESCWDRYCRLPGRVHNGDTLDVACDHYHRYAEDCALIRRLGLRHYRFSIAWPRIYPRGDAALNQRGLDFYHRLLDALERNGITPWVTMFHWDLPQALEDRGGWRWRGTVDAFARYADTIVQAFGGRVKNWITLNEIECFTRKAYDQPSKPPGLQLGEAVINQTYHHALLCHGHGVRAVREHGGRGAQVGLTDNSWFPIPVTECAAGIAAARDLFVRQNIRVLDPIYRGLYSPLYRRITGRDGARVARGDFDLIALPTDFLGLNVYFGDFVRRGRNGRLEVLPFPTAYPRAASPWSHWTPQALYWGPRLAAEVYGVKSIYITENGCGYDDEPAVNGEYRDLHRRDYLRAYLRELYRAIADGVPVKGYFVWSLLDNFEWQDGYMRRFGICHVDFATQRRTPKLSARWYAEVVRANRVL
jgi:beta-glucosidase